MRSEKELQDAMVRVKKEFDESYLFGEKLRISLHGVIMGLSFALGKHTLKEIIEDKTDDFINMTIFQQEEGEKPK